MVVSPWYRKIPNIFGISELVLLMIHTSIMNHLSEIDHYPDHQPIEQIIQQQSSQPHKYYHELMVSIVVEQLQWWQCHLLPVYERNVTTKHFTRIHQIIKKNNRDWTRHGSNFQCLNSFLNQNLLIITTNNTSLQKQERIQLTSTGLNTVDLHLPIDPFDGHFVYMEREWNEDTGNSMIPPCSISALTLNRHRHRLFWHSNSFSASNIFIYTQYIDNGIQFQFGVQYHWTELSDPNRRFELDPQTVYETQGQEEGHRTGSDTYL